MKMIDHNHFICHLILGTFTEYPYVTVRVIGMNLKNKSSNYASPYVDIQKNNPPVYSHINEPRLKTGGLFILIYRL